MTEHYAVTAFAVIAIGGAISQFLAWRLRLPAIVFLLALGIVLGPVSGWLQPDLLFGELLFPIVSLSVAIILFEGSLTLKFAEIRDLQQVVRRMIGVGSLISGSLAGLAAWTFTPLDWRLSVIFGALMIVTGPTVVMPMLRAIRPSRPVASILRWEGIVIDPIGAVLVLLAFELILAMGVGTAGGHGVTHVALSFMTTLIVGLALGAVAGYALGVALRRHWLPEYLHSVITLNLVLTVFVLANLLAEEAGVLAVTVMGLWMANMRRVPVEEIINFKETLSILLVSALFIILAARIEPQAFFTIGLGGVLVFLSLQFVARPLKVLVATWGSNLSRGERIMVAWIGPRGIVAAAIAALIALRLEEHGLAGADLLAPLVFSIIIATVAFQGATAGLLARWLGVAEPEPKGFLIIGANPFARLLARTLDKQGFQSVLVDANWDNIRKARMEGLKTYYGKPVSEHAEMHLDLTGLGHMLGLSADAELNTLAAMHYRTEFGRHAVFSLPGEAEGESSRKRMSEGRRAEVLFDNEATYSRLIESVSLGAEVRATLLTEDFDEWDLVRKQWNRAIRLAAIDPDGQLSLYTSSQQPKIAPGWTVLALVEGDATAEPQQPG